jgi:hypothetical protein
MPLAGAGPFSARAREGRSMTTPMPEGWRPEWRKRGERTLPKAPKVDLGPPPDFANATVAAAGLHAAAARRCWAILDAEDTTPQDVVAIYAATRLAARVGADRQPVKRPRLKLASILPPKDAAS